MKAYLVNLKGKVISEIVNTNKGVNKLRKRIILKGRRKHSIVLVIKGA